MLMVETGIIAEFKGHITLTGSGKFIPNIENASPAIFISLFLPMLCVFSKKNS
jgi:hypothetical protein